MESVVKRKETLNSGRPSPLQFPSGPAAFFCQDTASLDAHRPIEDNIDCRALFQFDFPSARQHYRSDSHCTADGTPDARAFPAMIGDSADCRPGRARARDAHRILAVGCALL